MKLWKYFAIFFLLSCFYSSCVIEAKCWSYSCVDPLNFQIIDKLTQQDLIFGINPKYKLDSLQLNKKPDFNTGYHTNHLSNVTGNYHFLQMSTNKMIDTSYLRITYNDIDTLIINFLPESSECCDKYGGYGKMVGIKYNGKAAIKNGNNFVFEK